MNKKINRSISRWSSAWTPVGIWALVIFLFSSLPTTPTGQIYWQDFIVKKSAHVVEFFVLSAMLYRALLLSGVDKKTAGFWAILLSIFYAVTDEWHQSFTPGREPTVRDVLFDTIGAISAIYFLWKLLPQMPTKLRNLAKSMQVN